MPRERRDVREMRLSGTTITHQLFCLSCHEPRPCERQADDDTRRRCTVCGWRSQGWVGAADKTSAGPSGGGEESAGTLTESPEANAPSAERARIDDQLHQLANAINTQDISTGKLLEELRAIVYPLIDSPECPPGCVELEIKMGSDDYRPLLITEEQWDENPPKWGAVSSGRIRFVTLKPTPEAPVFSGTPAELASEADHVRMMAERAAPDPRDARIAELEREVDAAAWAAQRRGR